MRLTLLILLLSVKTCLGQWAGSYGDQPFLAANQVVGGGVTATVGVDSTNFSAAVALTLTYPVTNSAGTDRYIAIRVVISDNVTSTCTATYANVSVPEITHVLPNNTANAGSIWLFGLKNPASGSNNVIVTASLIPLGGIISSAVSFTNVNQTTPTSGTTTAIGDSAAATLNVASDVNSLVVDVVGSGTGTTSAGGSQTKVWINNHDLLTGAGSAAGSVKTGAASTTMSWTLTSDIWGQIGMSVNHD